MLMRRSILDPRILRGMERQLKLRQDRLNAGEKSIGWKVGFGTAAAQERLGINTPLVGFLTDKVLLPSGASISIGGWTKAAVECEVAIHMGEDLLQAVDREATRAAIASLGPAFELADVDFPSEDVESVLAGNIYNRNVVVGRPDQSRAGCILDNLEARIYRNGNEVARTKDLEALTGDMIDIVGHVANLLFAFGERLREGEFIIAGTIIPHLWVQPKENVTYALAPIDTIRIDIL